jgi:K(+)-stimulated pyrophosphate-energized sodium pump
MCAGRGADLFESTAAENIGAMILGVALYPFFGRQGVMFPLVVRAFGLLASIAGVRVVRTPEDGAPMQALNRGYYLTTMLAALGFGLGCYWLLSSEQAP